MGRPNQAPQPTKRRIGARRPSSDRHARRFTLLYVEQLESRLVPTTVVLGPSKDNTLFESATGLLSNGAGEHFFAGKTNGSEIRRGMIAFDVAGSIPPGAIINSVSLRLNMSKTLFNTARTIALQKVLADWGEGTSDAPGEEGGGALATTNDATWVHRFFDTATWTSPGGDFAATVSASVSVGGLGAYTWGSTDQMVADVQAWLDTPTSNFGWSLLGNETASASAKRFDTKENASAANRPMLTIDYTAPSGFTPITVSGQAFDDLNGNGAKDATEPGLAGRTVFLDSDNNGTLDEGEPSTTTAGGGGYSFASLGPGTYRVRQLVPEGWQQTTVNPADIVAQSGVDVSGQDFGSFRLITISGVAFDDLDGYGTRNDGEPGLAGWTVFLDSNGNGVLDDGELSVTTDDDGNYSFVNLGPGTYRVRQVVPEGWLQTTLDPVDFVALSGTDVFGQDFGNYQ